MRTNKTLLKIVLTEQERGELERLARSLVAEHRTVVRAQIILLRAAGVSISAITRQVHVQRRITRKWIERFIKMRSLGLQDAPRSGRPARFSPRNRHVSGQTRLRAA
jgi:hypothetical protein